MEDKIKYEKHWLKLLVEGDEKAYKRLFELYYSSLVMFAAKYLRDTDLAEDYEKGIFEALTPEHYLDLLVSCLAHLSPDIVIHRVTGDGPKDLLIAPKWSLDKRKVLNSLHHRMKEQGIRQGDHYEAINKDKH